MSDSWKREHNPTMNFHRSPRHGSRHPIQVACLHPSAAFTLASQAFAEYEDSGIGVTG
jgi:hypothetical protein